MSFATSANAQEIVLNSVAISFVLELDEMIYETFVSPNTRAAYTAAQESTLAEMKQSDPDHDSLTLATAHAALVLVADVVFMMLTYFYSISQRSDLVTGVIPWWHVVVRGILIGAGHSHLHYKSRHRRIPSSKVHTEQQPETDSQVHVAEQQEAGAEELAQPITSVMGTVAYTTAKIAIGFGFSLLAWKLVAQVGFITQLG